MFPEHSSQRQKLYRKLRSIPNLKTNLPILIAFVLFLFVFRSTAVFQQHKSSEQQFPFD